MLWVWWALTSAVEFNVWAMRAQQLMQLSPGREVDIQTECHRLAAPQEMGSLFKVLGVAHKDMPVLAGFLSEEM